MSNLALLEYIHRINNALGLEQLETVADELRRADLLDQGHQSSLMISLSSETGVATS